MTKPILNRLILTVVFVFLMNANLSASETFWLNETESSFLKSNRMTDTSELIGITQVIEKITESEREHIDTYLRTTLNTSLSKYLKQIQHQKQNYLNALAAYSARIKQCTPRSTPEASWRNKINNEFGEKSILKNKQTITRILSLLSEKSFYNCTKDSLANTIFSEMTYKDAILYYLDSLLIVFEGNKNKQESIQTMISIILKTSITNINYGNTTKRQLKRMELNESHPELLQFIEKIPALSAPFDIIKTVNLLND